MAKRVLWLINHTTLREFEVPMLIEMGFEVYCPNMFPKTEAFSSASIERKFDVSLTIPEEILHKLNQIDFYEEFSCETVKLINEYFDIAFLNYEPTQFYSVVSEFLGTIIFRPFGLLGGATYSQLIYYYNGLKVFEALGKASGRFFYAQPYENFSEAECNFFKERTIYLPFGLKDAYPQKKWVGGDNRVFFVCPRIGMSPYFQDVYLNFKKDFAGYGHVIGGAQPIEPEYDDPEITGYMDNASYEYCMTHLGVMFYHSQEKRHIHYHPLEAVKNGMPLVFMGGGMLDNLGGKGLPGRAKTIAEAKRKIDRIFRGDKKYIERITSSQEVLLHKFSHEYCREKWVEVFAKISETIENNCVNKRKAAKSKKIAVLLTNGYTGGVLDVTIRLMEAIQKGAKENNSAIDLVFGYLNLPVFEENDYFARIRNMNIPIRPFTWKKIDTWTARNKLNILGGFNVEIGQDDYCLPDDEMQFFDDCDGIIFAVDRCSAKLCVTKPFVVLVHDYLQRYISSVFGAVYEDYIIRMVRESVRTLVMSPPTYKDAVMYAGLEEKKLALVPLMFDLLQVPDEVLEEKGAEENGIPAGEKERKKKQEDYFIWSTNQGEHKNHLMALKGLARYYSAGGKLKCCITGVGTDAFDPDSNIEATPYIEKVRKLILKEDLKKHLVFCGNMSKSKYIRTLAGAKFFMHPGLMDNGNMTAVDAACLGVPTISSDYPQMRYYEEYMHLNMRFFDPYSEKSIASALLQTEKDHEELKKGLPTREALKKFTIEETYKDIYAAVEEAFKIQRRAER